MPTQQPRTALLGLLVAGAFMAVAPPGITRAALPVYTPVPHWGPVPASPGVDWEMSGVVTTPTGSRLFALRRADPPILELDPSTGTVLKAWGDGLFVWAHSISMDPDGFLWVTDATIGTPPRLQMAPPVPSAVTAGLGHQVLKFSQDGTLLMTLGTQGVAGDGPDHFNAPTGVAVAANGDIFVSDGHGGGTNARVVRFSKDGHFITTWGTRGGGPGQFGEPHGIAIDSLGRVLVADRSNGRIQVFDAEGVFIDEWKGFGARPCSIAIIAGDTMFVTSHDDQADTITIGSANNGSVFDRLEAIKGIEGVTADNDGHLYTTAATSRAMAKWSTRP